MSEIATTLSLKAEKTESCKRLDESVADKLLRESSLISSSLGKSFAHGLQEAKKDPLGTSVRIGTVAISGAVLSKMQRFSSPASALTSMVALAGAVSAVADLANNNSLRKMGSAISDAWKSSCHINYDRRLFQNALGTFAFDSVVLSAAGGAGAASATGWRRLRFPKEEVTAHFPLPDKNANAGKFAYEQIYKLSNGITKLSVYEKLLLRQNHSIAGLKRSAREGCVEPKDQKDGSASAAISCSGASIQPGDGTEDATAESEAKSKKK